MFRAIRRSFTEGLKGMFKNGLMTVTSIFVVTSCIFVFGLFLMVTFNMNHITTSMGDNYQMDVYITRPESMESAEYDKYKADIEKKIKTTKNINPDEIMFTSGVAKFENFKKSLDESEKKNFESLPADFLPDLFTVKMEDISKIDETTKALYKIKGVESVENSDDLVKIIDKAENIVKQVSIWIIVIFALVSLFIISNTIKLTVHNRRKEINIMKYVGATDSYIRGPFIMEGVLVGLVSAVVAFFVSQWVYVGLFDTFASSLGSSQAFTSLLEFSDMWLQLLGAYVLLGCIIGAFGSSISVRRYLKV